MIRIYCQYSVSGYKIFQLNSLPHSIDNVSFVKMKEVNNAIHGEDQNFVITGTNDCNLDLRIVRLFSMNSVSLLYLRNIGINNSENALYLSDPSSKISFAFIAKEEIDKINLFAIASFWLSTRQNELLNLLQKLANMMVVGEETVFAFHKDIWQLLLHKVSGLAFSSNHLNALGNGKKNILSNLVIDKLSILKNTEIDLSLSSFVTIPGNEEVFKAERNQKIVKYTLIGVLVVTAIGFSIYYCSSK